MNKRKMFRNIGLSLGMTCMISLSGCANESVLVVPSGENGDEEPGMVKVGSFNVEEAYLYDVEGETQEVLKEYVSEDGLCRILQYPDYYETILDYENGTYAEVGAAYGNLIREQMPEYQEFMEPYLFENVRMAFNGSPYCGEAIEKRVEQLRESLPEQYVEESEAFARAISEGNPSGIVEDGKISYEEALMMQMIPDALRPTSCSALSLWGEKTSSGKPITLRLLEWEGGSENQLARINCVTRMKQSEKSLTTIGFLGILDVISAVNDDGVFVAILDVGSKEQEPFVSEGKKCYTYEIRYALENMSSAEAVGNYLVDESGDFTWCHNLIITDADDSFCAENCVREVQEKGQGHSILRTADTPLFEGLTWDSEDSLCVVNSFATEGNQDSFTAVRANLIRFAKYNEMVSGKDRFSPKDVKEMITREQADQYDVTTIYRNGTQQMILTDYDTGKVQVAFANRSGHNTRPVFVDIGGYGDFDR